MPRKARERSATGCYHIMARGINHTAIYNDDADNMNFLHILDFCADEDFYNFCVLPDGQPLSPACKSRC